eukprot:3888603-Amphidinium_carterae.2
MDPSTSGKVRREVALLSTPAASPGVNLRPNLGKFRGHLSPAKHLGTSANMYHGEHQSLESQTSEHPEASARTSSGLTWSGQSN